MKNIWMLEKDEKTKKIKETLERNYNNYQLTEIKYSTIILPFYYIANLLSFNKPNIIIFRYLNDYRSFIKTFFRFIAEIIMVFLCAISRTKIYWICHNIDRESTEYYPYLTKLRRALFVNCSEKILVTDMYLIPKAIDTFNVEKKIDYITFGKFNNSVGENKQIERKIINYISNIKREKNSFITLCAGMANYKTDHFSKLPELIDNAYKNGFNIYAIVMGDISKFLANNYPEVLDYMKNSKNVLFIEGFHQFNEEAISKYIDFYWRVYKDYSTPATIYKSAEFKKPILTMNQGFLSIAVKKYKLGSIVKDNFVDIDNALNGLKEWDESYANEFLKEHNWDVAVNKIIN